MDLLNVVIRADTAGSDRAAQSLDNMTSSARQADGAVRSVGTGSSIASGAIGQSAVATERATASARAHTAALQAQAAASRMAIHRSAGLATQLADVGQMLALGQAPMITALQQGPQIFSMYGNSLKGIGLAFADMGKLALGAARVLMGPVGLAIGAVVGLMAGLTHEINQTADTQVSMLDVMQAGWQLFAEGVASTVAPLFAQIGVWLQQGWDIAAPILKGIGNTIIGAFAFAIQAVGSLWNGLPAAVGDAIIKVANIVISGLEYTINKASEWINGFIEKYNTGLAAMGQNTLPTFGEVKIPRAANPYEGAIGALGTDIGTNAGSAFSTDYMGSAFDALSGRAQQIAAARGEVEDLDKASSAANKNLKRLGFDGFGQVKTWADQFGAAAKSAFSGLGSGIVDAFKKGGSVAQNVLDMIMEKVGKLGESLLNNGLDGLMTLGVNALTGAIGGFGMSSGLRGTSSITGSSGGYFPGFATGGDFTVGGFGGPDSQTRALRLTPGERVSIRRPDQVAANQNTANNNVRVEVHNHSGAPVTQEQSRGSDGVEVTRIIIGAVNTAIAEGRMDGVMNSTYGLKRRGVA